MMKAMLRSLFAGLIAVVAQTALSAPSVRAVASFSILGDLVQQVGGDRVVVEVLVGPGGDAHVFEPKPAHAKAVGQAQVVFANGLGFEGWMARLLQTARFKGRLVVVSDGVHALPDEDDHGHGNNPHAWQDPALVRRYVRNIAQGLCVADAAGCDVYQRRAQTVDAELEALDRDIHARWAVIAPAQRVVITSHDAFGYYGQAYGVRFLAPQGVSTDAEASARGVAQLVRQIKRERVKALFVENIADPRLMAQIARETGQRMDTRPLYSDSLAPAGAAAATYQGMMRYNTEVLISAILAR